MDWKKEVAAGDFYWRDAQNLPKDWTQGAFHGNGVLGSMVYFVERDKKTCLHMEIGCNNVYDRRPSRAFWMAKQFDNPRLPIGYMEYPLDFLDGENAGSMEFEMHTDIYNGWTTFSLKGKAKAAEQVAAEDAGSEKAGVRGAAEEVACRFYVCAAHPMIVVEQERGDVEAWRFIPREAVSPRQTFGLATGEEFRIDRNYRKNALPKLRTETAGGRIRETVCIQELEADYKTVTICQYDTEENAIFISVDQEKNLDEESVRTKLANARGTLETEESAGQAPSVGERMLTRKASGAGGMAGYKARHQTWWNRYYEVSGLSIPDQALQAFYWRQMYKLGCVLRKESRVLDNQGVWLETTPWPGTWWNLNVQLCYWPLYTSGRLEQADSLNRHLAKYQDDLIENVAPEFREDSSGIGTNTTWNLKSRVANPLADNGNQFVELGNLTWALHDCWLYYRMTMDQDMLREFLYPLLRRSVNYYLHFIRKGGDGKWHLPPTDSPEYGDRCEDCNYDLSLLKWGCGTLLEATGSLGIEDEKAQIWSDVRENLVEYPVNETGYMIGKDLPYAKSHRHFSHLFMHVPLYLVNRENSDSWELLEKSIRHWFSYPGDILGFSHVGASLMYGAYQKGNEALAQIQTLLEEHVTENSMYREAGPVIETPLAAAECIQQLLLQSWGGKIRVFPAMPDAWKDASFTRFSAQGGFKVSAVYEGGRTTWIEIESLAGEPCVVETDMDLAEIRYSDGRVEQKRIERHCEIPLGAGEKVKMVRYGADGIGTKRNLTSLGKSPAF